MSLFFQKVKAKLGWSLNDGLNALGLGHNKLEPAGFKRVILYHGIDLAGQKKLNSRFLAKDILEQHLVWFKENCWVVPASSMFLEGKNLSKPVISLSFDDGYRNNFQYVLPLLRKYNLPASFFISSIPQLGFDIHWADLLDLVAFTSGKPLIIGQEDYFLKKGAYVHQLTGRSLKSRCKIASSDWLGEMRIELEKQADFRKQQEWNAYWQLMRVSEIKEMASEPLVTLGSHGQSHVSIAAMSSREASRELADSKAWLESISGREIEAFSYPSGEYNENCISMAEAAGYKRQFAVDYLKPEHAHDPRIVDRLVVNPHISWYNQRLALAKGSYF